jgi:hypothetical protein
MEHIIEEDKKDMRQTPITASGHQKFYRVCSFFF